MFVCVHVIGWYLKNLRIVDMSAIGDSRIVSVKVKRITIGGEESYKNHDWLRYICNVARQEANKIAAAKHVWNYVSQAIGSNIKNLKFYGWYKPSKYGGSTYNITFKYAPININLVDVPMC